MRFNIYQYAVIAIIVVGLGSFAIGGLFVHTIYKERFQEEPLIFSPISSHTVVGKQFYATRTGSRYYPWWCTAGNISEERKVWFATEQAAIEGGYTRSVSC